MTEWKIPECFYRVSVKALVLDESRTKFLIVKEDTGKWELPGGGLDWGMNSHDELRREIREEMGLELTWIADNPCYFLVGETSNTGIWATNILYEATLESLDFTPSAECTDIRFVDKSEVTQIEIPTNLRELAKQFDPKNH